MDTSQYMDLFIDETKEHLQSLNEHVLVLEKEPEDADTINEIFRAAHTLKGRNYGICPDAASDTRSGKCFFRDQKWQYEGKCQADRRAVPRAGCPGILSGCNLFGGK